MSSDERAVPTIATYTFPQLEPPPGGGASARELLGGAWAEAEQIRAQARSQGHAEGRAEGLMAAHHEVESVVEALRQALDDVAQTRAELIAALEQDAVALAFQLAEHILASAIDVKPELVIDVARNALRRVTDRRRVILVVNPADLELVGDSVTSLQAELGGIEHCDVQSDRRIARGGAVLRTDAGEIDVTIDSQLERAREIVAAALKGEHDGA
jgi:flagellar assembly protein FliH